MSNAAVTLEQVLAEQAAAAKAADALRPVRDECGDWRSEEYHAVNRIINAAYAIAEESANAYVAARIIPAPENPAPGFTAKLAEVAADLADPAHLNWVDETLPTQLTGRIYISINGATWYEVATDDELNGNDWVTADGTPDPRGFSTKYEHCSADMIGNML